MPASSLAYSVPLHLAGLIRIRGCMWVKHAYVKVSTLSVISRADVISRNVKQCAVRRFGVWVRGIRIGFLNEFDCRPIMRAQK